MVRIFGIPTGVRVAAPKGYLLPVIILLVLVNGSASAQVFGSWTIDTESQNGLYAATVNDSGAVFGQFCYPKDGSCAWFLGMKTGCDKGHRYPVLVNSDAGSRQLTLLCDGPIENGLYRYAFTDFDAIDDVVRRAKRVGFAVPLLGDQFKVYRFLLDGAITAVTVMRAAAAQRTKPTTTGTHDETL